MLWCAGESKADHRELVNFCKEFKFERMGCFTYSEEDGTPAALYPEQVKLTVTYIQWLQHIVCPDKHVALWKDRF